MMFKILKPLTRLFILLLLVGLVGCMNTPRAYENQQNLILRLHQDIEIEAGRARVYLQNGKITPTNQLETYGPSCDFEVKEVSPSDNQQIILADDFEVTRVYYAAPEYGQLQFEAYQHYAQVEYEYPNTTYLTEFTLRSASQPDVLRLNCKIWSIDVFQKYLSAEQINHTLGMIATLTSK